MARRKKKRRSGKYHQLQKLKSLLRDRWTDFLFVILIIIIAYLAYRYGPRI